MIHRDEIHKSDNLGVSDKNHATIPWWGHVMGLCALACVVYGVIASGILEAASPEAIRDQVVAWGPWAPAGYLALFTFVPLTLFPDAILAIASGMAFGIWRGCLLTWIGALLGGSLAFWLARLIGQEAWEKIMKKLGHKPHQVPPMNGFLSILILRLVPLVPFDVVSYGAGLSHVRYRDFLAATAVGILPGVFVYVNVGDKLFDFSPNGLYLALALLIGLSVLSALGVKHLKNKSPHKGGGDDVH